MNNLLVNSKFRSTSLILVLMAILITTLPTVITFFYIALTHKKLSLAQSGGGVGQELYLKTLKSISQLFLV